MIENKNRHLTIRMTATEYRETRRQANKRKVRISEYIRRVLAEKHEKTKEVI